MKYFTPERYLQLGKLDDREALLAAHEDWERAIDGYKQRLLQIRHELPADLQQLIGRVYLHDAQILDMWFGGRSQFTITLHPESDPSRLIVLAYSLVEVPTVVQDVLPESVRSMPVAWLYDEFDLGEEVQQDKPTFTHNIMLSDGREIQLHFRNATVKRPVPLVPAAPNGERVAGVKQELS